MDYVTSGYLHQLVEVQLGHTGVIIQEGLLGSQQVFVWRALLGGLQGAENQRSHPQVQHDPSQQGQEGDVPHFLPAGPPGPPGLEVRGRFARICSGSQSGYSGAQLAINRKFLYCVCEHRNM